MIPCELFERHVGAFVDGELDASTQMEFEAHVAECVPCRERVDFEGAYRDQVRDAAEVALPAGLAAAVRDRLDEADRARPRALVPLASAAAVVLMAGGASVLALTGDDERAEPALEDVVRLHSIQLPADVRVDDHGVLRPDASQQQVSHWFRDKVAFPVRPAEFARRDVRLVGARLSNVRENRAAALYYELQNGQRLTVVVTDAEVEDDATEELRVGDQPLLFRDVHGHGVPVRREGNLRYAFTGDVDRDTLLQLAATARVRP